MRPSRRRSLRNGGRHAARPAQRPRWPLNLGNVAGETGESSRSRTRASRHTVALNSSRAEGDRREPHSVLPPLRGVLAGLAAALVVFGATPAFVTLPPPEPAPAH